MPTQIDDVIRGLTDSCVCHVISSTTAPAAAQRRTITNNKFHCSERKKAKTIIPENPFTKPTVQLGYPPLQLKLPDDCWLVLCGALNNQEEIIKTEWNVKTKISLSLLREGPRERETER